MRTLNRALESYEKIALLNYNDGKGKDKLRDVYEKLKVKYEAEWVNDKISCLFELFIIKNIIEKMRN